ncbi:thioredoxin [Candidatus Woesearchaeota archaeon]|nr:thioredoxin [Candidatus Woesearchaeota archaeon]
MEVTDTDFKDKVIEKSKEVVVVVDFWADWCVPCNMLGPVLEKVVKSYGDKAVLAKVNVDDNPKTSDEFSVNAIPAIKVFKDGKVVSEFEGVVPEDVIKKYIDEALQ